MDGIALVHRVRALAAKPTYVIMMTANADNVVMERGYCAGVDQYVSKKNMEAALPMRIAEGLKAIRLRRLGKRKLAHESVVTVDLNSGAHTARHLVGRLSAEIMLAQRTQSTVNVISLGVHPSQQEVVSESQLSATLAALKGSLRPQLDWVAWLHPAGNSHRFVVVLPSASSETATFVQSVRNTFVSSARELSGQPPTLSIGTFAVQPTADAKSPTAMEVLGKAESARRAQQSG
jgi:CheY-like chemotaxis protein